jgi:hypothetical protein
MRGVQVGPPAQHGLEEARRLDDLQIALFEHAVLDVHDDVAVALDARHMMDIDFQRGHAGVTPSSCIVW